MLPSPLTEPDRPDSDSTDAAGNVIDDLTTSKPPAALAPGLYIVATPIGNAADITLRALAVLRGCDAIACEDTRVSSRLLAIHGISRPLVAYHDHNAERVLPRLLERLRAGARIALVSDAGTPLISDPGYRLVRACREAGIGVVPVPGPSSVLTALCVSGLPTDRFLFAGFPPVKAGARRRFLAELAAVPATLVLFEAAPRLAASLADMAAVFGPRPAAIGRELTKMFEEVRSGDLAALAEAYAAAAAPPRGEITVVIAPPGPPGPPDPATVDDLIREALREAPVSAAAAGVAAATGLARRAVYARALQLAGQDDDGDPGDGDPGDDGGDDSERE